MAKSNKGSSMQNQGDRNKQGRESKGSNLSLGAKSKPAKQDAKKWKSKGIKNPTLPDWLA